MSPATARESACEWPAEATWVLDLRDSAQQRHLTADARSAEELAIRHADGLRGHRSGHFVSVEEYRRARDDCFATLTAEVASRHGVTAAQVADAALQRDGRLDAAVLLTCIVCFGIAANGVARRLAERFPPDERWPALFFTAAAAFVVSASGVIVGGLGATIVEMIHLGDTHLSYRTERLPWGQHWLALLVGAVALFYVIAGARFAARVRGRKLAEWRNSTR